MNRIAEKIYFGTRYFGMWAAGYKWLFVLGHMRSGSSLLVHLLNSNPEVLGYGETHLQYTGRRSFVKLHDHVEKEFETHGEPPERRHSYVMDKILHSHITNIDLLRQVPLSIIVIVRRPKEAIPSILDLGLNKIQTPEEAVEYYGKRIMRIQKLLEVYNSPFVFTKYSGLTERTNETLTDISEYLALDEGLTPTYDTMWSTGKRGIGDSSEKIKEGRVRSGRSSYDADIDTELIGKAREYYGQFCSYYEEM